MEDGTPSPPPLPPPPPPIEEEVGDNGTDDGDSETGQPESTVPNGFSKKLAEGLSNNGFQWHEEVRKWRREDGMEVWKTGEKPFPWAIRMATGKPDRRAHIRVGNLGRGDMLILDATAWYEAVALDAVLLELDEDHLTIHPFVELYDRGQKGELVVTPTKVQVVPVR